MERINKIRSATEALAYVADGHRVMVGGFGLRAAWHAERAMTV